MTSADPLAALRRGEPALWLRAPGPRRANLTPLLPAEVDAARSRLDRFRPVLASIFGGGWDGRIASELLRFEQADLLVKGDHALPMTGSVKARGGVYELLCHIERRWTAAGLVELDSDLTVLNGEAARAVLAQSPVVVASTGNLGYSIGLVARAFGMPVAVHMSHDAKAWKKDRLREVGAQVIEHLCDYTATVARARAGAAADGAYFIDDERSRDLFTGYSVAGGELAAQLEAHDVRPTAERPLTVYLPCGVGGAPSGIAAGLRLIYGEALRAVFVEPVASACMLVSLATGGEPRSIYEFGLDNDTIADGLAVAMASQLALDSAGADIDAVVAVTDAQMRIWARRASEQAGLRLEASAASALAARAWLVEACDDLFSDSIAHVAWATGGSRLPEQEFEALIKSRNPPI